MGGRSPSYRARHGPEAPSTQGREGLRRNFDRVARPEKGRGNGKPQRPIFQQAVECWNRGQYGHRYPLSVPSSGLAGTMSHGNRGTQAAGHGAWNQGWNAGYQNQGWGESGPSQAPATGDAPVGAERVVTEIPLRPQIISEEYTEVNGMTHYRRTFADGTVELEPW